MAMDPSELEFRVRALESLVIDLTELLHQKDPEWDLGFKLRENRGESVELHAAPTRLVGPSIGYRARILDAGIGPEP